MYIHSYLLICAILNTGKDNQKTIQMIVYRSRRVQGSSSNVHHCMVSDTYGLHSIVFYRIRKKTKLKRKK